MPFKQCNQCRVYQDPALFYPRRNVCKRCEQKQHFRRQATKLETRQIASLMKDWKP